ncbi:hypothetical protein BDN67DRAFT_573004 [Paxillus ammoniavirescens]|nr:hypothetical protein BDN67DRAFT_573004 [Paxillus ammoniavirescens]
MHEASRRDVLLFPTIDTFLTLTLKLGHDWARRGILKGMSRQLQEGRFQSSKSIEKQQVAVQTVSIALIEHKVNARETHKQLVVFDEVKHWPASVWPLIAGQTAHHCTADAACTPTLV